jgi:hypothetical protein
MDGLKALAIISKGTRRQKRGISLLSIGREIQSLYSIHKSLPKVASIVKISPEMVREFLKVVTLEKEVQQLVETGKIESVDMCYRLSKLKGKEQVSLAEAIVGQGLQSKDVRAIIRYKLDHPEMEMDAVIDRVIQSKNREVYVAYFVLEDDVMKKVNKTARNAQARLELVKAIFDEVIPKKLIIFLGLSKKVVTVKAEKEAVPMLRKEAKRLKVPLPKLANALVRNYLKE